jgi:hypothetical protein
LRIPEAAAKARFSEFSPRLSCERANSRNAWMTVRCTFGFIGA